jgi:signal transduction histidine kinase
MSRTLRRLHTSVFVKLVAIMVVLAASLLIVLSWFLGVVIVPAFHGSINRLGAEYARVIAAMSPSYETAQGIARRADLEIRYEGPHGQWATASWLPTIAEAERPDTPDVFSLSAHFVANAPDGGKYLVVVRYGRGWRQAHQVLFLLLSLIIVAVILTTYGVLSRMLRPLRHLGEGVAQVSDGQLDVTVPIRTRDEFGAVTEGFNQMVRRVRDMIHARDQLLVDVSHELRSPLTRLKVALELLPPGAERERMHADVAEMEAMVTELLELERLRDGRSLRRTRQDVVALLHDVARDFEHRPPGVQVSSATQIAADIDAAGIRTVIRNLIENGLKYSFADSRPVELSATERDGTVVIRVSDDGPGVPEQDRANVFEPFFRVDRSRSKKTGGYGLGLSICKRIVEAHGGTIAVENKSGRGAVFTVSLRTHS